MIGWAIITYNMGHCIEKSWLSVKDHVDQIMVGIDDKNTDNTEQWCKDHNVPYFFFKFKDFASSRNEVISRLKTEWILTLDPDETINPEHAPLMKALCKSGNRQKIDAYYFVRHNWFDLEMTKERMDVYPDHHIRLFSKRLSYQGMVHEQPGPIHIKALGSPIEINHFNMYYCTHEDWNRKNTLYEQLGKGQC